MILHADSMAALFVDQLTQVPVVVQCAQTPGQDPLWARLLFAAIPSILALGIAWLVFRWNGRTDHKRWILDQKKAEWKDLLHETAELGQAMPAILLVAVKRFYLAADELVPGTHKLLDARASCLFISEFLSRPENLEKFTKFYARAANAASSIRGWNEWLEDVRDKPASEVHTANSRRTDAYDEIRNEYLAFNDWLLSEARKDLGIVSSDATPKQE
jgi:hypothetical protein